jgi:multidrug resistance efflux pump
MFNKVILPLLAVAGLAFGVFIVLQNQKPGPTSQPLIAPPTRPPAMRSIAGTGIVEAQRRNIPIGTPVAAIVTEVFVKEGDAVKAGDRLFKLDDRELQADLGVKQAQLRVARQSLTRLKAGFRPEDREIARAALEQAAARFQSAEVAYKRTAGIFERGVGTQSDYDRDRYARDEAYAALAKARTEVQKLDAGSWVEDVAVGEAEVARAEADVAAVEIEIGRRTVLAPTDGQVLQVNVLPGQFAALAWKEPLIVLGDVTKLHVRVDIDEQDLALFRGGARAVATLKGRPGVQFELRPVRVDPYVIPKRNLTGDNVERVDTRVLQVIYALPDERPIDVWVGQQMDVYLEARIPKDLDLDMNSKAPRPFEDSPKPEAAGVKDDAEAPAA